MPYRFREADAGAASNAITDIFNTARHDTDSPMLFRNIGVAKNERAGLASGHKKRPVQDETGVMRCCKLCGRLIVLRIVAVRNGDNDLERGNALRRDAVSGLHYSFFYRYADFSDCFVPEFLSDLIRLCKPPSIVADAKRILGAAQSSPVSDGQSGLTKPYIFCQNRPAILLSRRLHQSFSSVVGHKCVTHLNLINTDACQRDKFTRLDDGISVILPDLNSVQFFTREPTVGIGISQREFSYPEL